MRRYIDEKSCEWRPTDGAPIQPDRCHADRDALNTASGVQMPMGVGAPEVASAVEGLEVRREAIHVALTHEPMQPPAIGEGLLGAQLGDAGVALSQERFGAGARDRDRHDGAVGQAAEHRFEGVLFTDEQLRQVAHLTIFGAAGLEAARQLKLTEQLIIELERRQRLDGQGDEPLCEGDPPLDDAALGASSIGARRAFRRRGGRRGGIIFASGFLSGHDVQYI